MKKRGEMMAKTTFEKDIQKELGRLPFEQQRQVLEFVRILAKAKTHSVPGKDLLLFAGSIDHEELMNMDQAIKDECEKVDLNEW
jgi:hypothetical protein